MLLTSLNTPSGFSPCVPGVISNGAGDEGSFLLAESAAVEAAVGPWLTSSEDERVDIDRRGTVVLVSRIAMLFSPYLLSSSDDGHANDEAVMEDFRASRSSWSGRVNALYVDTLCAVLEVVVGMLERCWLAR